MKTFWWRITQGGKVPHMSPIVVKLMRNSGSKLRENQAALVVPLNVNKPQIRNYMEQLYKIRVTRVTTVVRLGRRRMNRSNYKLSKRPDWKRAIITFQPLEGAQGASNVTEAPPAPNIANVIGAAATPVQPTKRKGNPPARSGKIGKVAKNVAARQAAAQGAKSPPLESAP